VRADRLGHVLCRLPLEHVTAARHVLCCGALSCRRPAGRAAGCGSRMRQQDATADGVGKVTILAILDETTREHCDTACTSSEREQDGAVVEHGQPVA
jgi:hypothetical protein